MEGKLKKCTSKGFGFIESNDVDFFFHHTAYKGDWKELLQKFVSLGMDQSISLEFDNDPTAPSGPRAINVRIKE